MTGYTPEYAKITKHFEYDYVFLSCYGYIADYLHAFQS